MVLGIALHGSISFIPGGGPWVVKDSRSSEWFGVFLASIHGFRMPLFFLLSGFFTMMLYRKRGLSALIAHRAKRIFAPLVLALLTITPVTWALSAYIQANPPTQAFKDIDQPARNIFSLTVAGDTQGVRTLLASGTDVDSREERGLTPLLLAAFFGRDEVAQLLIERGADINAKNHKSESVVDMLSVPWPLTAQIAAWAKVEVDKESLINGRKQISGMLPDIDVPKIHVEPRPLEQLIGFLQYFPLLGHLWFLWFLCWLVALFVGFALVARILKSPRPSPWLLTSPASYAWLIPLTMIPQAFMGGQAKSFGPDTSIGLLPLPAVFLYYVIFFGFGALFYDASATQEKSASKGELGDYWWLSLPFSILCLLPIGLSTSTEIDGSGRWLSVFVQASYVWLMTFGMIGLFRKLLSRESQTLRYLSDSSYWLYLAHIPLIIFAQYFVRDYELNPGLKFIAICAVTSALLLISYHLFVRYTPIGTLLNGKRGKSIEAVPVEAVLLEAAENTSTLDSRDP